MQPPHQGQGQPHHGQPPQSQQQPHHGQPHQGQPHQGQPQYAQPQQAPQHAGQQHPGQQHPGQQQQAQRVQAQPPRGSSALPGSDELVFEGLARHSAFAGKYFKWTLASIVGGVVAYLLGMIEFFSTWPLWILGFVGLPGMFWTFLTFKSTRYKITLRRVEFERGVLSKGVDSIELWRVLDVNFKQNIIDRMLGNASVTLISTDQTDPEFELYGLPDGRRLFERLRDAVQAARHTSRPMEMVGHDGMMENMMPPMQ